MRSYLPLKPLLLALLLFPLSLLAQDNCPKYTEAMAAGKIALAKGAYETALPEFQAAQIAARECGLPPLASQAAAHGISEVFTGLKQQKENAEAAEAEAQRQNGIALKAKNEAQQQRDEAIRKEKVAQAIVAIDSLYVFEIVGKLQSISIIIECQDSISDLDQKMIREYLQSTNIVIRRYLHFTDTQNVSIPFIYTVADAYKHRAVAKAILDKDSVSSGLNDFDFLLSMADSPIDNERYQNWKNDYLLKYRGKISSGELVLSPLGDSKIKVSDGNSEVIFIKHKLGLYTAGNQNIFSHLDFISNYLSQNNISKSAQRVILPVLLNEGKFDGINSWDNSFLSFGTFQWTLGYSGSEGELPALLKRIKTLYPEGFHRYFGQYGIDVDANTNAISGFLLLNGDLIDSPSEKEIFRSPEWAFRLWLSGQDSIIQAIQVLHCLDRINSFYHSNSYRPLEKFFIDQIITSEYGVSLILDHHVNRPGHLMSLSGTKDVIGEAMQIAGLADSDPGSWGDEEEAKLIEAYIPLRTKYKMTHGLLRSEKIFQYTDSGKLSRDRNSFQGIYNSPTH